MEILDRHHSILLDSVVKTFDLQAGVRLRRVHDGPSNTPSAESLAIRLAIDGGLSGFIAVALEDAVALDIAQRVLTQALGTDFDRAEIDQTLRANTVGELLNFVIGDFVAQMQNRTSSMIKVPEVKKYGDLIDEVASDTKTITLAGPEWSMRILYAFHLTES